jgi:hypothetical protein
VFLDSTLHFVGALLRFDEWHSVRFFSSSRGLWQDYPLSPLLFVIVIVMETLK